MNNTMNAEIENGPVVAQDNVTAAIEAAIEHAAAVYAQGRNTLVDQMSEDQWRNYSGYDEVAVVADPGADPKGIDMFDPFDDAGKEAA